MYFSVTNHFLVVYAAVSTVDDIPRVPGVFLLTEKALLLSTAQKYTSTTIHFFNKHINNTLIILCMIHVVCYFHLASHVTYMYVYMHVHMHMYMYM